jgi:predicted  nucleic acid-binding Zn ribbon protein
VFGSKAREIKRLKQQNAGLRDTIKQSSVAIAKTITDLESKLVMAKSEIKQLSEDISKLTAKNEELYKEIRGQTEASIFFLAATIQNLRQDDSNRHRCKQCKRSVVP